jgi:hypothetical protein
MYQRRPEVEPGRGALSVPSLLRSPSKLGAAQITHMDGASADILVSQLSDLCAAGLTHAFRYCNV